MKIGVPKEIKTLEFRVGLVPPVVHQLTVYGHQVFVETGAGAGIAALIIWNAPVTLTAKIRAKSTASRPSRFACETNALMPALLTR